MSLLVPDVGEAKLLKIALGIDAQEDLLLKLFTNNVTPAETDTAATYTELTAAAQAGYVAKTLAKASWTVTANAGVTTAGAARADFAQQTFTLTGSTAVAVYGYFVVGATSGILMWSEVFSGGPFNIPTGGGTINVTPRFELA